jgi:CelD/BcsL family acetyltransferase involved in cellulose biosynthesis
MLKSYYVDLEKVRRNNYDYLAIISPKQRYQIRRSIKEYEKMGKIEIRSAENADEALKILDELSEMHQKRWSARGLQGTMSSRYAFDFHRDLVSSRFEHGEVQLLKVTAGSHVLGCLYCFLYQGDVSGYMCGFNYLDRNVYSPGAVCHYYAVVHNAKKGFNSYDFLEGEDSYRERLSTDINMMETIVVRRKNIKYTIEQCIMRLRELYKRKYPAIRVVMHILPL